MFQNKLREAKKNCRIQKGTPYDTDNNKRPSKDSEIERERENESEKKEEICEDDAQKNKREKTRMQNIGAMLREKKSIR